MRPRSKYFLCGRLKVRLLRHEDVGNKSLRVPIDHRKPRALDLDHNSMATPERVVVRRKPDLVMVNRVRSQRLRLFKALQIATAKNVSRDHELITTHGWIGLVLFRIDVNHL